MMRRKKNLSNGFTMVELVIMSLLLSVLITATITFINPKKQFEKARDTRRRSDLSDYRTALEAYSAVHGGMYPSFANSINRLDTVVYPGALQPFMSTVLTDPLNAEVADGVYSYYGYVAEYPAGTTDEMALIALLESKDQTLWISCSNGKTGEYSTTFDLDWSNWISFVNNYCGYSISD